MEKTALTRCQRQTIIDKSAGTGWQGQAPTIWSCCHMLAFCPCYLASSVCLVSLWVLYFSCCHLTGSLTLMYLLTILSFLVLLFLALLFLLYIWSILPPGRCDHAVLTLLSCCGWSVLHVLSCCPVLAFLFQLPSQGSRCSVFALLY
jgi:hypothetical protein